jgi:DNA-binding transcriptional LysR family regulator
VVRDLLLADMGLGLLPRFAVAADLASGQLRLALPQWTPQAAFGATAWALWQPQKVVPLKLRAMVDFLVGQLGSAHG